MSTLEDFNNKHLSKKHVCPFCDFRTHKKYNLDVHKINKHRNENLDPEHDLIQNPRQPHIGYQEPVQVHRPWEHQTTIQSKIQDKIPLFYQELDREHQNLKNDFESLMKQKNDLVQENQDIKNNLSEQQTKMNVHTQRQGPVKEVYQQPGHVLQSKDMIGKGGAYRCGDTALRTQDLKTGQILPNRKRLRPNNDEQSETTSSVDSMEIDKHHKDFFSESDSEESDMDVGSELPDIMGGIEKAFDHILEMRKRYLKALEKYDEIDDEDKKDIIKQYVKLKGKIWGEWYDVNEESEEEVEEDTDGEKESEGDGEVENDNDEDEESEGVEEEDDQREEDQEEDKNHLMDFVLQLEYVADEEDKIDIQRLWKKELEYVTIMKKAEIDKHESDYENDDGDDDDDKDLIARERNIIENSIKEFKRHGNNYFKHCNKKKIETICRWCNKFINNEPEMRRCLKGDDNYEYDYDYVKDLIKENIFPVKLQTRKLIDHQQPIHIKRKLLQEVQVGKGVMAALENIALPFIKLIIRSIGRKGRKLK